MGLLVPYPHSDRRTKATASLSAYLWDLRAQAEAKLRCLTRLQQTISELEEGHNTDARAQKVQHILKDLTDIVTIRKSLHDVASCALQEAMQLA
jgi:ribosomal 50S subunit-associated protein YjgA (DUF615 family)